MKNWYYCTECKYITLIDEEDEFEWLNFCNNCKSRNIEFDHTFNEND